MKPSSSVKVVIDNESYFSFGHSEMPGNNRLYTKDKSEAHSELFFVPSRGNANDIVYRKECSNVPQLRPIVKFGGILKPK